MLAQIVLPDPRPAGLAQGVDDGFFHGFGGGEEQFTDVVVVDHAQVVGGRRFLALTGGRRYVIVTSM